MPQIRQSSMYIAPCPAKFNLGRAALLMITAALCAGLGGCGFGESNGHKVAETPTATEPLLSPATASSPAAPAQVNQRTEQYIANIKRALAKQAAKMPPAQANGATATGSGLGKVATANRPTTAGGAAGAHPAAGPAGLSGALLTAGGHAFPNAKSSNGPDAQAMAAMTAANLRKAKAKHQIVHKPPLHLAAVLRLLRRRSAARPAILQYPLALSLLDSLEKTRPAADPVLKVLRPGDRRIVADLTHAISLMVERTAVNSETLAQRAAPLIAAARRWADHAHLTVPRLVLCSRVDSFGVYTPLKPKFTYGRRHTVIIYCEVAHFLPKKNAQGLYVTRLAQQDTLMTNDGLLIWRPNPENVEDRSLDRRHDFYLVKKMTVPDTLAIGKYTLRMSVTDRTTHQIAQADLPIEIVR